MCSKRFCIRSAFDGRWAYMLCGVVIVGVLRRNGMFQRQCPSTWMSRRNSLLLFHNEIDGNQIPHKMAQIARGCALGLGESYQAQHPNKWSLSKWERSRMWTRHWSVQRIEEGNGQRPRNHFPRDECTEFVGDEIDERFAREKGFGALLGVSRSTTYPQWSNMLSHCPISRIVMDLKIPVFWTTRNTE